MYLCNFVNISLCRKVSPFQLNKLKSSSHRGAFCKVWLKLAQWYYWRRFIIFRYFVIISPWKKCGPSCVNKVIHHSPKDALCQISLKLAHWFWRRRFFKISSMYFHFFLIITPRKRLDPFIWISINFFIQRWFVPNWGEIGPVVLDQKIFKICQCIIAI